jgi:hygromycin-B 7''-O-kinase
MEQAIRMVELPEIAIETDFERWWSRPDQWLPLVNDIAREAGINPGSLSQFGNSTNLVIDLDDRLILKLFPPIYRTQFISERNALRYLAGKMDVPIPSIEAEGERNGWGWLIITRLDGIVGSIAWPLLPEEAAQAGTGAASP